MEQTAALVAANAESAIMRGEVMTLLRWGEALPESAIAARPGLALLYAWASLVGGKPAGDAERWLQIVEADEKTAAWSGVIRGYMELFQEDLETRRLQAEEAATDLSPQSPPLRKYEYLLLARLRIAEARPKEALALLNTLLPHFERHRSRIVAHLLYARTCYPTGPKQNNR